LRGVLAQGLGEGVLVDDGAIEVREEGGGYEGFEDEPAWEELVSGGLMEETNEVGEGWAYLQGSLRGLSGSSSQMRDLESYE
jgi:hypothetical protein